MAAFAGSLFMNVPKSAIMPTTSPLHASACEELLSSGVQCVVRNLGRLPASHENDVETRPWPSKVTAQSPHTSLRTVAPNRISVLFARNKSNTTLKAVLLIVLIYQYSEKRRVVTLSLCKDV